MEQATIFNLFLLIRYFLDNALSKELQTLGGRVKFQLQMKTRNVYFEILLGSICILKHKTYQVGLLY